MSAAVESSPRGQRDTVPIVVVKRCMTIGVRGAVPAKSSKCARLTSVIALAKSCTTTTQHVWTRDTITLRSSAVDTVCSRVPPFHPIHPAVLILLTK